MQSLETKAKEASASATQTIAAANAVQPYLRDREAPMTRTVTETLIIECTETAERVPPVIGSIKESQAAQSASDKFRAQSSLIRDTSQLITPATRLVEAARRTTPIVTDQNMAQRLHSTSQELSTKVAELRVALSNAQQLNFDLQLEHSEDLIRELDRELQEIGRSARSGQLHPLPGETTERASSNLINAARQVSSSLAQLISAANADDRQHIGASAVESAQSLRTFTKSIHEVCATRKDAPIENLIVNARSVVHDSGRVFDRVRERAAPQILDEVGRTVATSLRQTLSCLPDNVVIERAIEQIRGAGAGVTAHEPIDLRIAATKLIEAGSDLVVKVRAPEQAGAVNVFVKSYTDFHTAVSQLIQSEPNEQQRMAVAQSLDISRDEATNVLVRFRSAAAEPTSVAQTQSLTQSTRALADVVNVIVDRVSRESPWARECDNALRQIESYRHILDQALLPVNQNGFYESLESVTEQAKLLGEGKK